jgi:probable HAF family extracellular repeat protein
MKFFRGLAVGFVLTALASVSSAAVMYSITDLGTFGGVSSFANSINNHGQVVGWYDNADGKRYAFLYDNGRVIQLGTLGGTYSVAISINNQGQIVGNSTTAGFGTHAFIYENGSMRDLVPNGPDSLASAINDQGQIIGLNIDTLRASLLVNGTAIDLGTPGPQMSFAMGINNRGQIVGNYDLRDRFGSTATRAYLYDAGKVTDLGTLYGNNPPELPFTSAEAINDQGQIVGRGDTSTGHTHAFLYSNGVMRDLGTLGMRSSQAYSINNLGEIVGILTATAPQHHGFIYRDGLMSDLNDLIESDSGWTIQWARDINDFGLIAAVGVKDGVSRGIILTPIPEPAALFLLVALSIVISRTARLPFTRCNGFSLAP